MLQLMLPLLGFSEMSKKEAGRKNPCYLALSVAAHLPLQHLSFDPSLPCTLGLSQGESRLLLCSGEPQAVPSQQDTEWLQTLGILLRQPVPGHMAPGGSPAVCRCAGLEEVMGQGTREHFLSTQQQGVWQEALSDASRAQRIPQGR